MISVKLLSLNPREKTPLWPGGGGGYAHTAVPKIFFQASFSQNRSFLTMSKGFRVM